MIRRRVGNEFWLITQHDHALLSGELARQVGNKLFDAPTASAIKGISLHDCGWPVHDDQPTLNAKGQPIDVFESTSEIGLRVWQAGSERAAASGDDYAALLVSLHVLSLSVKATTPTSQQHETFAMSDAKTRFEVNRFQHYQIELQERLRKKLGLPVDVPMRHGLAEDATTQAELMLHFHFRLLQAMDLISLALCCTNPPLDQIPSVIPRPGARALTVTLKREQHGVLRVSPWMFRSEVVSAKVPYCAVAARNFESVGDFHQALRDAPIDELRLQLHAGS